MFFIKSLGTHISEHKGHKELSLNNPMVEFLNPEYVYIPLVDQNTPCEPAVKVGDHVKIGQVVANKGGRFALPLHATVSGEVVSIDKKMWHSSGKMIATIQIKNDFKETKADFVTRRENVSSLSKEEIIEIVRKNGIVGLGGSGFPAYIKYNVKEDMDVVIINAVECEPFITIDYMLIKDHFYGILKGLKYIMKVVGAKRGVIAIKNNKNELIDLMNKALSNEPEISVFTVKDEYPAGWEKYIVQRVTKKNYKSLPSEVGAVVNNASTAFSVYKAVEENQPLMEKVVTMTGEGLAKPCNVIVKVGTSISEVIDKIGGYAPDLGEAYFVAGGPMTGKSIMFDSLIIHRALGSVVVLPKNVREVNPECMGCGKCSEVCPVFLSPIVIKETLETQGLEELRTLRPNLCMECGLCSYICPSRIELTEAVSKAKSKVMVN